MFFRKLAKSLGIVPRKTLILQKTLAYEAGNRLGLICYAPTTVRIAIGGILLSKIGEIMGRKRRPLIKVFNEQGMRACLRDNPDEAGHWIQVTIAPDPDKPDEKDYPLYGQWYFRYKPGSRTNLRTQQEVSRRLLDKDNEEYLLALKSGLIDGIEL